MATLILESFPDALHARLKEIAEAHQRSVAQETIRLLETALAGDVGAPSQSSSSYWARRNFLPEYEALIRSGALAGGTDSGVALSEERDAP